MSWFVTALVKKPDWVARHEYYDKVLGSTGKVHRSELMRYASAHFSPDELLGGAHTGRIPLSNSVIKLHDKPPLRQMTLDEMWGRPQKRQCTR